METKDIVIIGGGSAGMAAAVAAYEKGIRDIPIDYVIRLARFYDCSVDYLLSVSSKKRKFGD